jgi:hypothetical protein
METLLQNNIIKYINLPIINKNIIILSNIHNKMKEIYDKININTLKIENTTKNEFNFVLSQYKKSELCKFAKFKLYYDNIKTIIKLSLNNIIFYVTDEKYINESKEMLKITLTFAKYNNITNKIIIIWSPICANRDFEFSEINEKTLNESINNFNAFSSSGVTFGNITIITRKEEAIKLMLHELVHNYDIDGSNYHEELSNIIKIYEKTKNINHYKYDYCIYESYAELLSSYFSMIFRNITINNNNIKTRLKTEIIIEILHSYNTISNIIKLNGYHNIDEFIKNGYFKGKICFYEYYYLKALLHNNFVVKFGHELNDFKQIYEQITAIKPDKLLKNIFNNSYKKTNFKYIYY